MSLTPRGTTLISYALSRSIAAPITIAAPLALAILTCAGAALHRAPPIQNSILTYENLKKKLSIRSILKYCTFIKTALQEKIIVVHIKVLTVINYVSILLLSIPIFL